MQTTPVATISNSR